HLALDDGEDAALEVRDGDSILDGVIGPVERPLAEAGQVEDGLAKRLTRDGAAVETDAADRLLAVDDGDVLAGLRGGYGALLSGGAAPDHDQLKVRDGHLRRTGIPRMTVDPEIRDLALPCRTRISHVLGDCVHRLDQRNEPAAGRHPSSGGQRGWRS